MLVPGISETAVPATNGAVRSPNQTTDFASHTFADVLAGAKSAGRDAPPNHPSASDSANQKGAAQPTQPEAQPRIADSAAAPTESRDSRTQQGILSQPSKSSLSASGPAAPKQKPGNAASTVATDPGAAAPPVISHSIPVPISIAFAPDPIPATIAPATPSLTVSGIGAQANTKAVDALDSTGQEGPNGASGATEGLAIDAAQADTEEPAEASDSTAAQNQPQQALPSAAVPGDASQLPIDFLAASVQASDPVNPQNSAKPPVETHQPLASQAGTAVQDVGQNPAGAPQAQPILPDDRTASATASAFTAQKHEFVAAALHAVSSSIAGAIQAPFTAAASESSKNPMPATPIASGPSIAAPGGTSQTASGSGSGAGSSGQSSSGHANTQSGGSPSQDTFPNHAQADAAPPMQLADAASSIGATVARSDLAAAQSNQGDASVSSVSSEKTSASSQLANSLQTAVSSASVSPNGPAVPGAQVSQAHLFAGAGTTEMRISVNTDALGPIELQATSDKDRIGAVIAAAKPETQELLANELPTLHQALSERNLQVQQLTVSQGALAGGMSGRGGYSQSPDAWQKQAAANYWQPPTEVASSAEDLPGVIVSVAAAPGKLSVHA
jgi:Flagellar hook-length control protein FliK